LYGPLQPGAWDAETWKKQEDSFAMRLVTRSDFDGLVCAVLLKQVETLDTIQFVHPKDLQDGKFAATSEDILANVPYVPGCGLWFDHHLSEVNRVVGRTPFQGECRVAPSAARVVYDYYGGRERFGDIDTLMAAVDKADSAQFTREEILQPTDWTLLSFIMDARTGLGRFQDYRISNVQLMHELIDACTKRTVEVILALPDVEERVRRYWEQDALFREMVRQHSWEERNVVVSDLRGVDPIYCGNRFMIYALYPEQNASIWIVSGKQNQNCVFACGKSILNKSCGTNIGALCRELGGGGHEASGTCQVAHEKAEETLRSLLASFHRDEEKRLAAFLDQGVPVRA
jgi:nanoRNase/pAp phosphatase (c-di-AMP/oligoRNAs hydrolase)